MSADTNSNDDSELTGLPWPKSWNGAYILVITSFILWIGLLITLEFCS